MKSLSFLAVLTILFAFSSCKDGTNIFNRSKEKNQTIERLEKENQALRMELNSLEEEHQNDITNIRSDYEQKLAELQQKIEEGTLAEFDAYYVVVGSFKNMKYAQSYATKVKQMGYEGKIVAGPNDFNLVTSGTYNTLSSSIANMKEAREKVASKAWVYFK